MLATRLLQILMPTSGWNNHIRPNVDAFKRIAPCYVYDEATITASCRRLANSLPQFEFLYSTKANPFAPVVRTVIAEGFGADAASAAEVELAGACGAKPEYIYYSAPGKTESDLRHAIGKCTVVADSIG